MITTTRLPSGLTVVTERMPGVRSVAIGFWVAIGARDEPSELAGASHFLEHLLFKGTEARTAHAIAEAVDEVGGEMNAYTAKEHTSFELRLTADQLQLGLDILSDIVWAPSFRPDEVEAERAVILEEILLAADEPADAVHDLFIEAAFPDHPLGRQVLGSEASIAGMGRDDIAAFHARHYRPNNVVVAAAGSLDHDDVVAGVAARFAGLEGGEPSHRTAPGAEVQRLAVQRRRTEQVHLVVGARAFGRHDPDRPALAALDHIIGGGLSSRLFQEIREKRGLAYSVYSYRSLFADDGVFAVYAGTAPRQAAAVVALVQHELDRVLAHGITERELEVAKGHVRGALVLGLEDSESRMSRLGRAQVEQGQVATVEELLAGIEALTVGDLARVAERVLAQPRVLAVVGPVRESDLAPFVA